MKVIDKKNIYHSLKDLDYPRKLELDLLLGYIFKLTKEEVFLKDIFNFSFDEYKFFNESFNKLKNNVPIEHIINKKEFYGLDFYVNENVLIPRPDSELLVEEAISFLKQEYDSGSTALRVIEFGTGTGAIGLAVKSYVPNIDLILTDISIDALDIAKRNANDLNFDAEFIVSDLFENINGKCFDLIIANLPYIGTSTNSFVSPQTKEYEPHIALFGGSDGLDIYRRFFIEIKDKDIVFKFLIIEFGFDQKNVLIKLFEEYFPEYDYEFKKDLALYDRIAILKK